MKKTYIRSITVITSIIIAVTLFGITKVSSDNSQNDIHRSLTDTVQYTRPVTVEVNELKGCLLSEFDTVFGQYVFDNYNGVYLTDYAVVGERQHEKTLRRFDPVRAMKLNARDTVRILIAKYTGDLLRRRSLTSFVFKGSRDSVFFVEKEQRTLSGYFEVNDTGYVYRVMHLRRSVPYRLMMHDSIDMLPRRFWKPLVPGEGDAFAVKLYIDNGFIRRAEVTHFYDVLVDSAFECPDDRREDAAQGYNIFPKGSPEWEYLNKYEPGEKEYLDSVRNLNEGYFIE